MREAGVGDGVVGVGIRKSQTGLSPSAEISAGIYVADPVDSSNDGMLAPVLD